MKTNVKTNVTTKHGPVDNMWRVDVAGVAISVRGETAKLHLEKINNQLVQMKNCLYRMQHFNLPREAENMLSSMINNLK